MENKKKYQIKQVKDGKVKCVIFMSPKLYMKFKSWRESKEIITDNQGFTIMIQKVIGEW